MADANTALVELRSEVGDFTTLGPTLFDDLPDAPATYTGILSGGTGTPEGDGAIQHYADLSLTIDLAGNSVTGLASNFVTDEAGFENPDGTISLSGNLSNLAGTAALTFQGEAQLTQGDVVVLWDIRNADARFWGPDADAISGDQTVDGLLLEGSLSVSVFTSDGVVEGLLD